jgi:type II secretory pathway pseudopilin PulG
MMINMTDESTSETQVKIIENLKGNKALVIIIIIIVLAVAVLPSYYFYSQYKKTQSLLTNPTASLAAEAKQVVDEVGKLMVLPTTEQPTIATVSDVTKLADQPFFANAQNGDKVLIYTQAKKAILFRESIDKIIEVATPVNLGSGTPVVNPSPIVSSNQLTPTAVPANATVTIYNGTTTNGLVSTAENKIKAGVINAVISGTGITKSNYPKTIVVDLSGNQGQTATQIANLLGGTVTTRPYGETKPNTDILVIVGSDFVGK